MSLVRIVDRDRHDRVGEGALWSTCQGAVYWVDILGQRVSRLNLASAAVTSWRLPATIGWLIERRGHPGFVAGVGRDFVTLTLDPLAIGVIASPEAEKVGNRLNDAKADVRGRIWAGSMAIGGKGADGSLYRLDPDGIATRVAGSYTVPNGPAISPDGRMMFHADTALATVFRYPIKDDGSLGERTPHIVFEPGWGRPDGMTLDVEGGLWVACWGGAQVIRFTPDGRRQRAIALPASRITSCTFAGASLDRMFVTSAGEGSGEEHGGALFEVDPGVRGLPTEMYMG